MREHCYRPTVGRDSSRAVGYTSPTCFAAPVSFAKPRISKVLSVFAVILPLSPVVPIIVCHERSFVRRGYIQSLDAPPLAMMYGLWFRLWPILQSAGTTANPAGRFSNDQCHWKPPRSRPDPVELLVRASRDRLPELLPIKWARMAASPFGFFRGAVPLMAADLASLPTTGITVQICGDAHVRNLGAFASPTGALVFDINDFDETMPGPWE